MPTIWRKDFVKRVPECHTFEIAACTDEISFQLTADGAQFFGDLATGFLQNEAGFVTFDLLCAVYQLQKRNR